MSAAELDAAFEAALHGPDALRPDPASAAGSPAMRRVTARRGRPAASEREFQADVVGLAEGLGLRVFWVPSMARTNIGRVAATARGWPDLVIAGRQGVLLRELKYGTGTTSAEQDMWLWLLHHAGLDAAVWREPDWASGRIESQLRAIAGPEGS
jgi:hypothetical protein